MDAIPKIAPNQGRPYELDMRPYGDTEKKMVAYRSAGAAEARVSSISELAAVGSLVYSKAVAAGRGTQVPVDLFMTRKSPTELYAP